MTLPLRPVPLRPTRPTRRPAPRPRRVGVRLVHAGALLALVLGLAACGSAGATPVAGDPVSAPVDGDGDTARCLPDAVDCDDTPGGDEPAPADDGDAMVPEDITVVDALPAGTPSVEMAPGSSAEPFRIFIQEAVVDGTSLQVSFNGGETPCFVVDHTEVLEDAQQVIVSVFVSVPDPSADCSTQEIFLQSVPVQLSEPLGDRLLKDGSRTVVPEAEA